MGRRRRRRRNLEGLEGFEGFGICEISSKILFYKSNEMLFFKDSLRKQPFLFLEKIV
jgi:hypothetical protein